MSNILLLGSQSHARQLLLGEVQISFMVIGHSADETVCDWALPFDQLLSSIAVEKMNHIVLPEGIDDVCYVLTADTMGKDIDGTIHGKPCDIDDAREKIRALRKGGHVATAFCLDKKRYADGVWTVQERIIECVSTRYEFDMPDAWIDKYFQVEPNYLSFSGAINIEGFAAQFLKSIDGSYTTIIGLPMFQLRQALERVEFFV